MERCGSPALHGKDGGPLVSLVAFSSLDQPRLFLSTTAHMMRRNEDSLMVYT